MKRFLAFLVRFLAVAPVALMPIASYATDYTDTPFTDNMNENSVFWTTMEDVLGNMTLFFGIVVVLAILVTGFFLGRKWLRRVG